MEKVQCTLTPEGLEKLKARRERIIARLAALEESMNEISLSEDTSENIEFRQMMRERMGMREEIDELGTIIKNARVIKHSEYSSAQPGCKVKLVNHRICYMLQLVHALEANSLEGKVSCSSPLGQSLLGKRVGEEITTKTPLGEVKFNVASIM